MPPTPEQFQKAWTKIIAKAWTDEAFKAKLLNNPIAVLKDYDIDVPKNAAVTVHPAHELDIHLVLPPKPSHLTEEQLKAIAAGRDPGPGWVPSHGH